MLVADNKMIDLGVLKYGSIQNFEYEITNDSPKDVVINKLQVSCSSCTKAVLTKSIKGSSKATMKVTYTPGSVGKALKYVDIIYDTDQRLRVEFKAEING